MSKQIALRGVSPQDSLKKTVRMLTRSGVDVQFRGFAPRVETRGGKVIRMVLPEVGNDPSEALMKAMHGFLDHECGHIFYTPFARYERFCNGSSVIGKLSNIVEDIRLEKLLPRDLPGTKENLARMYEEAIPRMFAEPTAAHVASGDKSRQFFGVLIPALRALAGQKAFQTFMDDNKYWPFFAPLLTVMPNLSRRLRDLETFPDVEQLVTDLITAIETFKPKEPDPEPEPEDGQEEGSQGQDPEEDKPDDEGGGEGHGDGSGTDDEEGDEDDTSCSGSDEGDEEGSDEGDSEGGEEGNEEGDSEGGDSGTDGDGDDAGDKKSKKPSDKGDKGEKSDKGEETFDEEGDGKTKSSITDALKQLLPAQRRAMFMYKKRKLSVSDIAEEMLSTEDQVKDLLVSARRRLKEIMNGG